MKHACVHAGLALLAVGFGLSAFPAPASAYAWMVRHGYTSCAMCHTDPSGGSLLTAYGRAQGVLLLASRYGASAQDDEAAVEAGQFLFGAFELPATLLLGGDVRGMQLEVMRNGDAVDHLRIRVTPCNRGPRARTTSGGFGTAHWPRPYSARRPRASLASSRAFTGSGSISAPTATTCFEWAG